MRRKGDKSKEGLQWFSWKKRPTLSTLCGGKKGVFV
jgi:hypothetical protein